MKPIALREALSTRWHRTLFIVFFAQLMTAVGFSSIFPFLPLYVKDLGSKTHLSIELLAGLVFSSQAFTMMLASPIWGTLADRYGRKLMVVRSMFGGSVILLFMAFVRSAEELVLLRAIQGFITGTVAASNALVASMVPRERMGYAMGLLQVGIGSGVAFGPLIGGVVADAFGYGAAFYVTSALLFLSGLTVLVGVREEFSPGEGAKGKGKNLIRKWRQILAMPGMGMTYGVRFVSRLGRMMVVPILPLFVEILLEEMQGVNTFTGLVIGVGAATTTLSAIYLGRLGDRVGHRRIFILSAFFTTLMYLPQSLVMEGWQLLALYALVGVGMGGIIPSVSALLAGYSKPGEEGSVYGLDNSIQAAARSLAPLLGSGVALWFGIRGTFVVAGFFFLLALFLAIWKLSEPEAVSATAISEVQTQQW